MDQLLFKASACAGGPGHIGAEANAQLGAEVTALQGFAVGGEVSLAIVIALPAALGCKGFAHIKQKRLLQLGRSVHHQVDRRTAMGGFRPAPETHRQGSQRQGIQRCGSVIGGGTEQIPLGRVCCFPAEERRLVVMQALLSGDRDSFLKSESEARRLAAMPPYSRLAALVISANDEAQLHKAMRVLAWSFLEDAQRGTAAIQ